jgi:hypothetical protein
LEIVTWSPHPENRPLALGHFAERLRAEGADGLASGPSRDDEAGFAEATEVVAHEGLAEPDVVDQLADAGRAVGQPAHDAQPVHVGEGLVEDADLAEVVRLVDDRGDRAADPGGRGAQLGSDPARPTSRVAARSGRSAMRIYIKRR